MSFALLEVTTLFGAVAGTTRPQRDPALGTGSTWRSSWPRRRLSPSAASSRSTTTICTTSGSSEASGGSSSRLLQSFGVAMILLAGFYVLFPPARIADGPFYLSILLIVGFLLPARALGYCRHAPPRLRGSGAHRRDGPPGQEADRGDRRAPTSRLAGSWAWLDDGPGPERSPAPPSLPGAARGPRPDREGGTGRPGHRRPARATRADARRAAPRAGGARRTGRGRPPDLRALHQEARHRDAQPVPARLLRSLQDEPGASRPSPTAEPRGRPPSDSR